MPSGVSGCNGNNCSRIWWSGAGALAAVHMIWYDPERWQKGGSRRDGPRKLKSTWSSIWQEGHPGGLPYRYFNNKRKTKENTDILLNEAGDLVTEHLEKRPRYSMRSSCWSILLRLALKSLKTYRKFECGRFDFGAGGSDSGMLS